MLRALKSVFSKCVTEYIIHAKKLLLRNILPAFVMKTLPAFALLYRNKFA